MISGLLLTMPLQQLLLGLMIIEPFKQLVEVLRQAYNLSRLFGNRQLPSIVIPAIFGGLNALRKFGQGVRQSSCQAPDVQWAQRHDKKHRSQRYPDDAGQNRRLFMHSMP